MGGFARRRRPPARRSLQEPEGRSVRVATVADHPSSGESRQLPSRASGGDVEATGCAAAADGPDCLLSRAELTTMRRFIIATLFSYTLVRAQDTIRLKLDATDAPRRLLHVQMTIPAKPGAMTLLYPQWIPGEHGPTGPIQNLVGLKIRGGGQTIAWKRDGVNMYAFHIDVPTGVSSLAVAFDFISPPEE